MVSQLKNVPYLYGFSFLKRPVAQVALLAWLHLCNFRVLREISSQTINNLIFTTFTNNLKFMTVFSSDIPIVRFCLNSIQIHPFENCLIGLCHSLVFLFEILLGCV